MSNTEEQEQTACPNIHPAIKLSMLEGINISFSIKYQILFSEIASFKCYISAKVLIDCIAILSKPSVNY
jgi:hypothetical protein